MDFTDIEPDDLLAQIAEMEAWLTGCCDALCVCGKGDILDPERHWELCPYSVAAESEVDGCASDEEEEDDGDDDFDEYFYNVTMKGL